MHGFICLLLLVWTWGLLGDRSALAQANLDETMLRNVDAQVSTAFFGLRFNRQTGTYVGFVTATNHSATPVSTPLYLVVTAVTPGSVRILNAQGTTVQQHAYYDLSRVIAGGVLVPQATTARLTLEFRNPTNAAIQIKASVFVPAQERT
ncbi:MAG: hypothetical protein FJZ47_06715, partial [Candidatus Tectomicrobia bacterium]|nr:hypothetical protein [Candidatus Tectomicrobia bacterium]